MFRLPGVSLIIPFLLFICVTPLATVGAKVFLVLYLLPAGGLAYILLTRTIADAGLIRTTGLLGGHRITWADLDGLEFHGPRWAIAVGTDGKRLRLPMVRPRDLPRLARVSGGRLLLGADAPTPADASEADRSGDVEAEPSGVEAEPSGVEAEPSGVEAEPSGVEAAVAPEDRAPSNDGSTSAGDRRATSSDLRATSSDPGARFDDAGAASDDDAGVDGAGVYVVDAGMRVAETAPPGSG